MQTWTDNIYQEDNDAQTDLQNIENNFLCLKSMFSGAAAPGAAIRSPFMPWFDTGQDVLKFRDSLDAEWFGLFHGDSSQKIWVYRNGALTGWAIDSSVFDKVLTIKGGATYVNGGDDTQGSWNSPAGSSHNHQFVKSNAPSTPDEVWDVGGNEVDIPHTNIELIYDGNPYPPIIFGIGMMRDHASDPDWAEALDDSYTSNSVVNSFYQYRPAAGVGTLQSLDL